MELDWLDHDAGVVMINCRVSTEYECILGLAFAYRGHGQSLGLVQLSSPSNRLRVAGRVCY